MPNFTAGTSFTDGVTNDVTAAKLNALVADAVPTSNLSLNSTTGTIANFTSSTATITGTITGSTNVVNIGSGQIYKDSSGNVGIGVSSLSDKFTVRGTTGVSTTIDMSSGISTGTEYGSLKFTASSPNFTGAEIRGIHTNGGTNLGVLAFHTSATERLRIDSSGNVLVGKTLSNSTVVGGWINTNGKGLFTSDADAPLYLNRLTNDGVLVEFAQASTLEGTISVSGNTVSYNPFAGSHWSQLEDGSRPEILRGTVLESVNQLCQWPDGGNERFAKCKISDTVASKKVYGVFLDWDNSWDQTNDLYVTAVGLFVCRINASVTVQIGDLLESNGDGTARVQEDDVIRSSTIGKVTSSVKTHEHPDGSYCVPTVLYCG